MSDIKLFRLDTTVATELHGTSVAVEKSLQTLIEQHLHAFFAIRFLATEHSTGKIHGGRVDTLGIDENNCPVIIEYKRAINENVINQGLFYLDWLMDHKADFKLLVLDAIGKEVADAIVWSAPRLLCIASDFTKYDEHAVQQINRNIELLRYRRYGQDLVLFELVNATVPVTNEQSSASPITAGPKVQAPQNTFAGYIAQAKPDQLDRYEALIAFLKALGDDVQMKTLQNYIAFKRIKNFACVEVHPNTGKILVYVKVNPDSIGLEHGFTRDVRKIGHFGTGDLEIILSSDTDLEKAQPLLTKSYEAS